MVGGATELRQVERGLSGFDAGPGGEGEFDGGGDLLTDATQLPEITAGLAGRNYTEADIRKILGGNQLRLLRQIIG